MIRGKLIEPLKRLFFKRFEVIVVGAILITAFLGTYFISEPSVVLHFYYLPVLIAAYFLGRRMGLLTAILSITMVFACALIFPSRFFSQNLFYDLSKFMSWGGFLILASVTVGSLYEANERKVRDLKIAYVGIVEILSKYLESTDQYTKGHSVRVSELAQETALAMGVRGIDVENIRVAGLLHDIGKIEVSKQILRKAAKLSGEEREIMNGHAEKGAKLLSCLGAVLKDVVPIVEAHHRYYAGSAPSANGRPGYIPLGARIVAVADSFDAMTSDRPYRKGMTPLQALRELADNSGSQFDPLVVSAFKRVIEQKLAGHRRSAMSA